MGRHWPWLMSPPARECGTWWRRSIRRGGLAAGPRPRPRQNQPRQTRKLQDEERTEGPGVAVGGIAGRGARPQVDDLPDRPLPGEDHREDHEVAGSADAAGIVRGEGG